MHTILLGAAPAFLKLLLSAKLVCVIVCVVYVCVSAPEGINNWWCGNYEGRLSIHAGA